MCYELTGRFPQEERFGLTSQMRRAAVSIPSNIAEGHGRGTPKAFLNHLWIANGSLKELETQLLISQRLEWAPLDQLDEMFTALSDVGRMLTGLRRSLEKSTT